MQPLLFNQWREGISYTNCHLKCVFKAPKVSILSHFIHMQNLFGAF